MGFADQAVLLDSRGRVEQEAPFDKPGVLHAYAGKDYEDQLVPDHVKRNLDKATEVKGPFEPRNSLQTWEETLYAPTSDGAAAAAAAEAIMIPLFTIPANYMYPGRLLKYTLMFRHSSAITTPGTFTYRLRWGATTGLDGVVQAVSAALVTDVTGAGTNLTSMIEWWCQCRTSGTAGTGMTFGRVEQPDVDDAAVANVKLAWDARMIPQAAPATAVMDTTVSRVISPTYQPSLSTASLTTHVAVLEALT